MKNIVEKLFNWIMVSNRRKHMFVGWCESIIFLFMYGICISVKIGYFYALGYDFDKDISAPLLIIIAILNLLSCAISMCSVEYIQKQQGVKWDWLDILAGIIPAVLILIAILLIAL